jgi:WD40 repeat protein
LYNIFTGSPYLSCLAHTDSVRAVAFSTDGKMLASGSEDGSLRLWGAITGERVQILYEHNSRIWSLAFSPDGILLASGSTDQTIRLWKIQTGECLNKRAENSPSLRDCGRRKCGHSNQQNTHNVSLRLRSHRWAFPTAPSPPECQRIPCHFAAPISHLE